MPRMMLPAASRGKLQGAQRHALVELDVLADVAGLADDDAGAVVDEEAGADAGAGVDVDAGLGVGVLGHHARDQRHAQQQQLVGDAIDRDRLQAGIAEDDLVMALGRRVALVRRPPRPAPGRSAGPASCASSSMVFCWASASKSMRGVVLVAIVPQGAGDLLGQLVVQAVDQVADVVLDVADVQVLPAHSSPG